MPTQEQAEKAWKHGNKGKKYYDAMTEEQKKAMWQYGYDRKLVDTSKLGPGALSEYQKYVNPSKPEYAMQASIVQAKPKQYYQTQNEKIMSAITPSLVKNMASQAPEQIAAKKQPVIPAPPVKQISGRRLEDIEGNIKQPIPIRTNALDRSQEQYSEGKNFKRSEAVLAGLASAATLGAPNKAIQQELKPGQQGYYIAGNIAGSIMPGAGLANAAGKGLAKLGAGKLVQNLGGGAIAGAAFDTTQGIVEGDTGAELAKRVGRGAVIGLVADGILMGMGAAGKGIMNKLKNRQALSTAEQTIVDKLPAEAKKEIDFYVDQYGNAKKTSEPTLLLSEGKTETPTLLNREAPKTIVKPSISPEIKPSNINTLPMENKSVTGQIKAQGEAATTSIKPATAQTAKEAVSKAPIKKDISGFQAYTTDVYRNFEKVFGDDYAAVKKDILDPFDNAKKSKVLEDQQLMSNLKKNIVDKFNIQKGSKESALVQQYGEKRLSYESLVKQVGKAKADNIVEADKWFRAEYDRLIDEVNVARAAVYPNQPDKLIPHRTDYYRHFNELSDTFAGLKNIFETPSQISPSLAGASEFTKPKSKFLSFAQKRGQGKFTDDAVGGFLDYINAATYAKHIDTQIPKFRGLAADLAEATEQSKNMNNFIGYLTDFANDLSGKTNPADRFVQKIIPGGRTTFKALNWLNSRVKANTILGNLSSSLSQIANIPQGIAYVKNPVHISKGTGNFLASIFGKGDANLYKKSGFLLERYSDNIARQFDVKLLDQPKKAAAWMLGALDEVGTKSIWSSVYQKGLADKVADPIKYADDVTRKLVAGRGIGEVPLLQKSKVMQLIAPFTLEVNNLWKVQKDFIKAKDFGGLALLYLANFALNKGMEEVRGDGVVFDPIQAIYDALSEEDLTAMERAGRLGGEVLSNVPLGSTAASLYPEYGVNNEFVSLPTREKLFGRNDPTRFGSGLLVAKGLQDPLYKIAPPFAGGQIKKTVQAGQDLGLLPKAKKQEGSIIPKLEKQDLPASYSQTKQGDRLRTTIDPTPGSIAKGLAFGRGAIPELKAYYESGKVPFGTKQTENFKKLVDKGYEPNKLFKTLNGIRGTAKKADIVVKLRESGYNSREITEIWEVFYK
jgi:hypothetical protein